MFDRDSLVRTSTSRALGAIARAGASAEDSANDCKTCIAMDNGVALSHVQPVAGRSHQPGGPSMAAYGGVSYEDEYVKLNSTLQVAWSESVEKDIFTNSTTYQKVEVLMLSWEPKYDDLKVQGEIEQLKEVFEHHFHFHVVTRCLERIEKRKTQNQVNKIIADWVYEHDGRKTLLIVYFAGHGRPGESGELEITGRLNPSDLRGYLDTVVWNRTAHCLEGLDSDVLQIFDCCFAATMQRTRGVSSGALEFLAATSADATTPKPGANSFTSALIWSLTQLVQQKRRFTTTDLSNKIKEAPNFPPHQKPALFREAKDFGEQLIVLQPLRPDSAAPASRDPVDEALREDGSGQDVLTLKFVFATRPNEADIRNLGIDMNHVIIGNRLKVKQIEFGGIRPQRNELFLKAVSRFRAIGRRHSKSSTAHAAEDLLHNLEDEVEQHVLARMQDRHEAAIEGSRREFEAHSSVVRARERGGSNAASVGGLQEAS